jgi:hypothetical protein
MQQTLDRKFCGIHKIYSKVSVVVHTWDRSNYLSTKKQLYAVLLEIVEPILMQLLKISYKL